MINQPKSAVSQKPKVSLERQRALLDTVAKAAAEGCRSSDPIVVEFAIKSCHWILEAYLSSTLPLTAIPIAIKEKK